MTNAEFIVLVAKMRAKQTLYFQTKSPVVLNEARDLERQVDKSIKMLKDRQCHLPLKD